MRAAKGEILFGNCFEVLDTLPAKHFHCSVTSPPYWRARNYPCPASVFHYSDTCLLKQPHLVDIPENWDLDGFCKLKCGAWRGVLGMEPTIDQYIKNLVMVMEKIKCVMRDDGVCWINIGDQYAQDGKRNTEFEQVKNKERVKDKKYATGAFSGSRGWDRASGTAGGVIKKKSLTLAPERLAIALQEAGWIIRSRVLWLKSNALSQSAPDRPSPDYEHVWMLTKGPDYFYNREAVRKPGKEGDDPDKYKGYLKTTWDIHTQPSASQHSSTYPDELCRRAILLSTADKCCSECGAPYQPVIEKGEADLDAQRRMGGRASDGGYDGTEQKAYSKLRAQEPSKTKARILQSLVKKEVVDWINGCECGFLELRTPVSVPCRVLDPFAGVGTSVYVAVSEGRDATGIELDPESFQVGVLQASCAEAGLDRKEVNRMIRECWPVKREED